MENFFLETAKILNPSTEEYWSQVHVFSPQEKEKLVKSGQLLAVLALRRASAQGEMVASGKEALQHIKEKKPNLLILDIMMPEMDGWEVCKRIKEDLKIKLPVLILTARVDDLSKDLSKKVYQVNDYLTKPFLNEDLIKKVKAILK